MNEVPAHKVRKLLSRQIAQLSDVIADLDSMVTKLGFDFYRACIFGSARINANSKEYKEAEELAFALSNLNVDIVTGGGPGLMEAANIGAQKARKQGRSIGLPIELPFEADSNGHLDVKYHHRRFSSRLDEFMRISHAVIITPGGIGTLLELLYTWQLIQVEHMVDKPVILLGKDMWTGFLDWMREEPLKRSLMSESDFERITLVDTVSEVVDILLPDIKSFQEKVSQKEI